VRSAGSGWRYPAPDWPCVGAKRCKLDCCPGNPKYIVKCTCQESHGFDRPCVTTTQHLGQPEDCHSVLTTRQCFPRQAFRSGSAEPRQIPPSDHHRRALVQRQAFLGLHQTCNRNALRRQQASSPTRPPRVRTAVQSLRSCASHPERREEAVGRKLAAGKRHIPTRHTPTPGCSHALQASISSALGEAAGR
jgi:hypothetical protein